MKMYRRKLYMERTERTRCVSIHAQPPTRSRHLCFFGDNNIEKTNKPSAEALNYRVFMCDQKHTSAMKMSCSAAFNRTFNILHCRSFILINTLGFETHPDANIRSPGNLGRVWIEASAMGETVSGIIVSFLSETLQPLWAREQGEAGISLTKSATEHKYNPCVGLFYS